MNSTKERRITFPRSYAAKTDLNFGYEQNSNTNQSKIANQPEIIPPVSCFQTTLCDFCRRVLPDGSIRFNFQAACPACYEKAEKLVFAVLRRGRKTARKTGGEGK